MAIQINRGVHHDWKGVNSVKNTDRVEILSVWDTTTVEGQYDWGFMLEMNSKTLTTAKVQEIAKTLDSWKMYTYGTGKPVLMMRKISG